MSQRLSPIQVNIARISNLTSARFATTAEQAVLARILRGAVIVLAGSALVAVCAHIAVPLFFTPVPLSLAPFPVLLLGLLLSPRMAAATLGAYLAEGALGLPVFGPTATAPAGLAHLLGPTGGYLMAYPLAAALIAFLVRRGGTAGREFTVAALSAMVGSALILLCGAAWLGVLTHVPFVAGFKMAVWPFLPGDALKVVAAAALATGFYRVRRVAQ